jgi:YbgC/YbaW family acyl-CoA thioester hydrolase
LEVAVSVDLERPIIYRATIEVRFADLDSYQHVNSSHYLDFVNTARLQFMERELQTPLNAITDQGVGWYLTKATQNFKRPITGMKAIVVESFVESVKFANLVIPFKILSLDGRTLYADGELEYHVVNLATGRATKIEDWMLQMFFYPLK